MFAVTLDAGIAGEHVADPLQRFFGVALPDMADQGVNHRHAEDRGIDPVPHDGGRRGGQQHVNQYVVGRESAASLVCPFFFRQRVRATGIQALGGVCGTTQRPGFWSAPALRQRSAARPAVARCRPEGVVNFGLFILVNLHFPYKFRESEKPEIILANEVKRGQNADKNV